MRGTNCSIYTPSTHPVLSYLSTLFSEISGISNSWAFLELHDPKPACFILISLSSLWFQHFLPSKSVMQLSFFIFKNINILKFIIILFCSFDFLLSFCFTLILLEFWEGVDVSVESSMFKQKSTCIFSPTREHSSSSFFCDKSNLLSDDLEEVHGRPKTLSLLICRTKACFVVLIQTVREQLGAMAAISPCRFLSHSGVSRANYSPSSCLLPHSGA